jgi:hypothetical protein
MVNKYRSSGFILSKIYRDLNLQEETRVDDIIEWIGEGLQSIGAVMQYEDRYDYITIENFRGKLPDDCVFVLKIETPDGRPVVYDLSLFSAPRRVEKGNGVDIEYRIINPRPAYKINGCYIDTTFEKAELGLMYKAFIVDEDGLPMVPDHIDCDEALLHYVMYKLELPNLRARNISMNEFKEYERMWYIKRDKARSSMNMPDMPTLESLRDMWVRLVPNVSGYTQNFKYSNILQKFN